MMTSRKLLASSVLLATSLIACQNGDEELSAGEQLDSVHANSHASFNRCSTRDVSDAERSASDKLVENARKPGGGGAPAVTGGVVNVYAHIINKGTGLSNGDIPDKWIADQIDVLNKSYGTGTGSIETGWSFQLVSS